MTKYIKPDYEIICFEEPVDWKAWLEKNHGNVKGVWMKFFKKNSTQKSINYAQALDVALCYGWIDSQVKSLDAEAYLQKFTPRGPKSIWSKINVGKVEQLIKDGKMKPSGIAAVESAKADGRWEKAYASPSAMKLPETFLKELRKNKKAQKFFDTLNKTNLYAIGWRLETATSPEVFEKRKTEILVMLEKGEKFH